MQKIKKFKISLAPASVRKNFKVLAGIERLTPEEEDRLSREYENSRSWLSPAAVFETFRSDRWPAFLTVSMEPLRPVAASVLVATIGPQVEEQIGREASPSVPHAIMLAALAEEGAESAADFVSRLITEEAKKEDCELTVREELTDPAKIELALKGLCAERIGVTLKAPGVLSPRFTRVASLLWIPRMTKKRRLLLPEAQPLADKPA